MSEKELAASSVSRDEMTRWSSTCGDGVLLPRESNPSRPLVGRQNGGCWMLFEYAYGGRQLCNSRLDQPRMVRGPGPSREGIGLDARWETRPSGIQTLPSYSGDLHLPKRLEGRRSPRDLHNWLVGEGGHSG